MKNLKKTTILLGLFAILCTSAFAKGKEFTGIIIYNVTYEGDDLDPQMMAMMPKPMVRASNLRNLSQFTTSPLPQSPLP